MKKLLLTLITVVCLLTLVFTLSACTNNEPTIEGIYYLQSLSYDDLYGEYPGITAVINMQTKYDCVVEGEFDFSKFYLEFKDGKMITHGSWEVTAGPNYKFFLSPLSVTEYNYELKKESETNSRRYNVYVGGISSREPYCSFTFPSKNDSAHIFRQYIYGNTGKITCNYYLEGSAELSR